MIDMQRTTNALPAAALLAVFALGACRNKGVPLENSEIPIACRLDALTPEERSREAKLLREYLASTRRIQERDDGYSFQLSSDPALFSRLAELISLEHRCCPFLNFQLDWLGSEETPWLHITGGARVKAFVAHTFARQVL